MNRDYACGKSCYNMKRNSPSRRNYSDYVLHTSLNVLRNKRLTGRHTKNLTKHRSQNLWVYNENTLQIPNMIENKYKRKANTTNYNLIFHI